MSKDTPPTDQDPQLESIIQSIIAFAQLDFSTPPLVQGNGPLNAIAVGMKALGEELEASLVARDEAEHANTVKARFLANMSHELRTPLTVIHGCKTLLETTPLTPYQELLLDRLGQAGDILQRLVSDVLDFSKVAAGALHFEARPFEVQTSLNRVMDFHRSAANDKGLTLRDEQSDLGQLAVLGDAGRLEQAVSNLVGNAIKYTDEGHVLVRLRANLAETDIGLTIEVEDTGPGIAAEHQTRIFERFTLGDSSLQRAHGGAGLGLAIARALAESMNGTLSVRSTLGEGACFTLTISLPIATPATIETPGAPTSVPLDCRVLVVDDTEIVRELVSDMLELLGCTVTVAGTGQEALTLVADHDFDLILMDWQMPEMDGLTATHRLLELYPDRDLKIAALTAHTTSEDKAQSAAAGMVGHLSKPFTLEELVALVHQHIPPSNVRVLNANKVA